MRKANLKPTATIAGTAIYLTGIETIFTQKSSTLVIAFIKSETSIGFVM